MMPAFTNFNLYIERLIKSPVFVVLIILLNLCYLLKGQPTVDDPFHSGEYLASATNLLFGDSSAYKSLQIHGLNDIFPALLTHYIWGPDHHFVPTLTLYRLIEFGSYLLLLTALFQILNSHSSRHIYVLMVAIVGGSLVGFRDFGLLLTLNFYLLITKNQFTSLNKFAMHIAFGLVAAFAMYYSFDRGIIGVAAFGCATLLALGKDRFFLVSIIAFIVSVLSFQLISNVFSVEKYLDNLLFLISNASQWSYEFALKPMILAGFGLVLNLYAYGLYFLANLTKLKSYNSLRDLLIFGLLAFLMYRLVGINRADIGHVYQSYWVPLLLLSSISPSIYLPSFFKNYKEVWVTLFIIFSVFVVLYPFFGTFPHINLLVVCLSGFALFSILGEVQLQQRLKTIFLVLAAVILLQYSLAVAKSVRLGQYTWIASLAAPPENMAIASAGVRWSAEKLVESQAKCVFDLSNNGVINSLAKLPVCTKYTYPVYAGKKDEDLLISQLKKTMPSAIVYSSNYWSYSIDNRSMASRFPILDEFLTENYPIQSCEFGYCVRYQATQ